MIEPRASSSSLETRPSALRLRLRKVSSMGKGKRRSKKKKTRPEKTGSDGPVAAAPAPVFRPSSSASGGAAAEEAEGLTRAPVANRECINCDHCGVANPQKCCSRCLCAYYCSKECQRAHWKGHKRGCAAIKIARDHYNAVRDKNNLPGETPAVIDGPCAVCLEEEVKNPVTFECGHAFCFGCIVTYQRKEMKATCPYCRGEIPNVFEKARDRYYLYFRRAEAAQEGSEEREKYCHLAMAEYDAASQLSKDPEFIYFKAWILSLSKDPEALLKVTGEILSGIRSWRLELDHEMVVQTKLWRAQAYLEMGKWTDASEIYFELRKDVQLHDYLRFLLEMGHCRCLFQLGDYHQAVECGNRAVKMKRNHPGVHECLALAQKAAGNIDAAKKTMLRAILHEKPWNVENKEKNMQILRDL